MGVLEAMMRQVMQVVVMGVLAASVCFATVITVPSFVELEPDVALAVEQYQEAVVPALNGEALAVQAELSALGSDTDLAERAALSVRAAAKAQAVRNLRAVLTEKAVDAGSSVWGDLAYLEALRISEPESMLTVFPEGRGLWVYYVEPSPNTGNAYWYTREYWEVVRTRYTVTDRVELKRREGMSASAILGVEELKASTMWGAVE